MHNTDQGESARVPLDFDFITRAALGLRRWRLEFQCHGCPFVWTGEAANQAAAETLARHHLATDHSDFNPAEARMTACLEQ